jgi:hypothetical protein
VLSVALYVRVYNASIVTHDRRTVPELAQKPKLKNRTATSWDTELRLPLADSRMHRNLRTRRRMSSLKWTVSLVKQGKFKEGVAPADRLGCLLLKSLFVHEHVAL